jgi:hypothetical protein
MNHEIDFEPMLISAEKRDSPGLGCSIDSSVDGLTDGDRTFRTFGNLDSGVGGA